LTGRIDFLIIGAEKSGTTWLADRLRQHPKIFIPAEKELFYFNERFFESPELPNFNASQPLAWYLAFFDPAAPDQIKGEASPAYLWDKAAPGRIAAFDPDLKLIAVLRDPIERAFSQYLYFIQRGLLAKQSFENALETRLDFLTRGLYAEQLLRYFDLFPSGQVRVGFFDDLKSAPRLFLGGIQAYLGVPEHVPDDLEAPANVTGIPRFPLLNRGIAWVRYPLRKYNPPGLIRFLRRSGLARLQERVRLANTRPMRARPAMLPETRSRLCAYFRDDVETLQEITGRDLSSWIK
jgi:hypothetical protein